MYEEIHKRILKEVIPSKEYTKELASKVNQFTKLLKKLVYPLEVFIGGSYAKGTWLPRIKDIDIFIIFPKNKELSNVLEKKISALKPERIHGSRDYFRTSFKGISFEIIPIVKIRKAEEALNITDISPLHVEWVNANTDKKTRNEIRILKLFLKANNLYGAESYIRGFSGYACEILIVYYKTFYKLIKDAASWKDRKIIDIENYYTNKNIIQELNPSKLSPLIVIDPVQASRNAAAAISEKTYKRFIKLASDFLRKPEIKYFRKKIITRTKLEKEFPEKPIVWLKIKPLKGKDDIIGSKIVKVMEYIREKSTAYGFKIIEHGWDYNLKNTNMWFVFNGTIPRFYYVRGPAAKNKIHAERFRQKHKNVFEKQGVLWAKEKRKFTHPLSFILNLINDKYITERISKIKVENE